MKNSSSNTFKSEILPKRNELMKVCALHKYPTICVSAVPQDDGTVSYETDMVSAADCNMNLKDDMLVKVANVLNGFDVVESNKPLIIED